MTSTMTLDFRKLILYFGILIYSATATSTLPPQNQELDKDRLPNAADLELTNWLNQHSGQISVRDRSLVDIQKNYTSESPLTVDFALLIKKNLNGSVDANLIQRIEKKLQNVGDSEFSPLVPYVYAELMKVPNISFKDKQKYSENLDLVGGRSCAKKQLVLSHLNRESPLPMTAERIEKSVEWLSHLQSYDRNRYLRDILRVVPVQSRARVRAMLREVTEQEPRLLKKYPWLAPQTKEERFRYALKHARLFARRRSCSEAMQNIRVALSSIQSPGEYFDEANEAVHQISRCRKRYGYSKSRKVWRDLKSDWHRVFGEKGKVEADVRIAKLYWQQDHYQDALTVLEGVMKTSQLGSTHRGKARLLYSKILENMGSTNLAINSYLEFVKHYGNHPDIEEGLSDLLLLYMAKNDLKTAEETAYRLVALQDEIPRDERDVSSLGFALFWLGRISLKQNNPERAVMYWKRLAREYYSTYYGALGHYLAESVEGKTYELLPARTGQVRMANLLGVLTDDERQTVLRSMALLRLGLQQEAKCEIVELGSDEGRPHLWMLQSLVLHAGGDWLKSIVKYGKINRTFRQGLPSLTERLLFPRRFHDVVETYATKLKMDPDFVLSLIRQESVFDPRALSGAGAVGLMQLMKATARGEAKKLAHGYVQPGVKQSLQRPSRAKLMEATSNIILGVNHLNGLLERFRNPVLALSAYNAGSRVADRWLKKLPSHDIFLFIENIPYAETRAYVKLILRNYFYYKRWYGKPGDALPYLEQIAKAPVTAKAKSI